MDVTHMVMCVTRQIKGVFTPGVFCEREKLSRPLFQQQKKLAALFVLKAPRAFFLSPSNEPTLDPDVTRLLRIQATLTSLLQNG